MKAYALSCPLLLGMSGGTICVAQPQPPIQIPSISFAEERDFPSFPIGTAIDIHVDPREVERAGGADKLHARIIRGSKQELKTKIQYMTGDGCLFYRTAVYPLGESDRGIKVLITSGWDLTLDTGWLSRAPGSPGASQSFVLVIETKAPTKDVLKIRPEDARRYFDSGLEFIVKSNQLPLRPEQERELVNAGQESLAETTVVARLGQTHQGGCRVYSKISVAGAALLESAPCPLEGLAIGSGAMARADATAVAQRLEGIGLPGPRGVRPVR